MRTAIFMLLLLSATAAIAQSNPSAYGGSSSKPVARANAQAACPWLTAGSAAKALGGDVSVTVDVPNKEGTCKFVRQQGEPNTLEIFVGKSNFRSCSPGSVRLTGIGNEAEECRVPASHGEISRMVSSRVRELPFSVTLTDRREKSSAKSQGEQDDVLAQIAEQVAGNLY